MRLIRVFPRTTKATPDDELVRFGPPGLFDEADEVHISVAFTYDKPYAETPYAMLWRPETESQQKYTPGPQWQAFTRQWRRPALIHRKAS